MEAEAVKELKIVDAYAPTKIHWKTKVGLALAAGYVVFCVVIAVTVYWQRPRK